MAQPDPLTQEYHQAALPGLLTVQEAWELENLWLLQDKPESEWLIPPPHLQLAVSRLWLMEQECPRPQ